MSHTNTNPWVRLGRQRNRLTAQVYARDTHCCLCKQWVDQTLPPGHPMSRTAHHLIELQDGGPIDDITLMALAHWSCNARAGARRQAQRRGAGRQVIAVDPTTL